MSLYGSKSNLHNENKLRKESFMRWCKKTTLQPYSQAYDVVLAEEKV
jgi:hypothetical protein